MDCNNGTNQKTTDSAAVSGTSSRSSSSGSNTSSSSSSSSLSSSSSSSGSSSSSSSGSSSARPAVGQYSEALFEEFVNRETVPSAVSQIDSTPARVERKRSRDDAKRDESGEQQQSKRQCFGKAPSTKSYNSGDEFTTSSSKMQPSAKQCSAAVKKGSIPKYRAVCNRTNPFAGGWPQNPSSSTARPAPVIAVGEKRTAKMQPPTKRPSVSVEKPAPTKKRPNQVEKLPLAPKPRLPVPTKKRETRPPAQKLNIKERSVVIGDIYTAVTPPRPIQFVEDIPLPVASVAYDRQQFLKQARSINKERVDAEVAFNEAETEHTQNIQRSEENARRRASIERQSEDLQRQLAELEREKSELTREAESEHPILQRSLQNYEEKRKRLNEVKSVCVEILGIVSSWPPN